ncbi:nucleoside hydrolase [Pelagicoccus mobilis]|uniref:Nucleoside hydrolase n=1 Tax=Pelagicoccus mobilis TaxID=415221 RepID=A0A934VT25_9BACT|nr:nucleoside hydrolase [Pelagicoccus mobilis]MBK1879263.1 nucleoside hydrolase [Pelagicoccus mobilis]
MERVIIDSDWGGDVLQLASVLLSRPSEYEILGATVVFGNASLEQNLENAGAILKFLGVDDRVARFRGAAAPSGCEAPPEGDDAHGRTGLGEVVLPLSEASVDSRDAVDFLIEAIEREAAGSVCLIATGPQTNVAQAIRRAPEVMKRLKEIRIMGGCVRPLDGYRVNDDLERTSQESILRRGNITEWAEFNFQQAAEDAATVLDSGIPVVLFPMDCTHQLMFTPAREAKILERLCGVREKAIQLIGLLRAPEAIDQAKFALNSVMHDVNTTVSMVRPELYEGIRGTVSVGTVGRAIGESRFEEVDSGAHWVAKRILDPDAVFEELLRSLRTLLLQ